MTLEKVILGTGQSAVIKHDRNKSLLVSNVGIGKVAKHVTDCNNRLTRAVQQTDYKSWVSFVTLTQLHKNFKKFFSNVSTGKTVHQIARMMTRITLLDIRNMAVRVDDNTT